MINDSMIIIGLGGNLSYEGARPEITLNRSIEWLSLQDIKVLEWSPFYISRPVPPSGQPDFVNAALQIVTDMSAAELLEVLHQCETKFGRKRSDRWEARSLDLDLLVFKGQILPSLDAWNSIVENPDPSAFTNDVMVPHPRLHKRSFALTPLLDLWPDFHHPILGVSGRDLLNEIKDQPIELLDQK
ncbi:2-amino-4-hydroxy-6-hydroxymethyldihydropteridine diphosphokinase [Temperatibacter marinus]|uniref:2-amino-4-hydroxy-6-hydroxymethyldihydropteridine pyrophosphokinase n=1 Tax=Temperatibacter marinus TaxID=1456591 RepID=A0AA52EH53_9PROT|nr:2-amino-4-hydroxy-6-hydroxymethyldihydropteridine diphosphokinase [Temperatibacter marinus]WND01976.1 2-amino-4-hydroxy-6-hydroxymethyldihydropteridine diphosphokinase [Temperatibacter marinus]